MNTFGSLLFFGGIIGLVGGIVRLLRKKTAARKWIWSSGGAIILGFILVGMSNSSSASSSTHAAAPHPSSTSHPTTQAIIPRKIIKWQRQMTHYDPSVAFKQSSGHVAQAAYLPAAAQGKLIAYVVGSTTPSSTSVIGYDAIISQNKPEHYLRAIYVAVKKLPHYVIKVSQSQDVMTNNGYFQTSHTVYVPKTQTLSENVEILPSHLVIGKSWIIHKPGQISEVRLLGLANVKTDAGTFSNCLVLLQKEQVSEKGHVKVLYSAMFMAPGIGEVKDEAWGPGMPFSVGFNAVKVIKGVTPPLTAKKIPLNRSVFPSVTTWQKTLHMSTVPSSSASRNPSPSASPSQSAASSSPTIYGNVDGFSITSPPSKYQSELNLRSMAANMNKLATVKYNGYILKLTPYMLLIPPQGQNGRLTVDWVYHTQSEGKSAPLSIPNEMMLATGIGYDVEKDALAAAFTQGNKTLQSGRIQITLADPHGNYYQQTINFVNPPTTANVNGIPVQMNQPSTAMRQWLNEVITGHPLPSTSPSP